jgi:Mor family transcriptional regulator
MNHQSKSFNKLQKDWYKRLKDEGFNDIETTDERLKKWESSRIRQALKNDTAMILINAKIEYYRIAEQFLYNHKFESVYEKQIWELHTEGKPMRAIGKLFECSHVEIFNIVKKLKILCFPKRKAKENE